MTFALALITSGIVAEGLALFHLLRARFPVAEPAAPGAPNGAVLDSAGDDATLAGVAQDEDAEIGE